MVKVAVHLDLDSIRFLILCAEERYEFLRGWAKDQPPDSPLRKEVEWLRGLVDDLREALYHAEYSSVR